MWKNYFITAWRNLLRNATQSIVSVVGLSLAFTVAACACLLYFHEQSYDHQIDPDGRCYMLTGAAGGNQINGAPIVNGG